MDKVFAVITSMDEAYYEHCGKLMIKSFEKHWHGVDLYCYNEDFNFKNKRWKMMGWNLGEDYNNFYDRWIEKNQRVTTFGKKAFSIIHGMNNITCDWLIWADADSEATINLNEQLLDLLTDERYLSVHFGVKHTVEDKTYFSCETGFFMLNTHHPLYKEFCETYKEIYVNDDNINLRRFYDGEVYGETVKRLENKGAKMLDLNKDQIHKTPIPRSVLGPYISHYKAGLKDSVDFNEKVSNIE
tara:strand:- start:1816 stop:2541 length:726 start_codon:yes stop_codon:yes gene_type:complete